EEIAAEEIAAEEVAAEELPLRSTPVRQHASLEAAANALMLFDPIAEDVAEPVSTDPIADTAVPADAEPKPYARTEVVLPVGVQLPKTARPARKESAPTSRGADANARSTDVTLPAFDTALDAFAGVAEQPPAPAKPAEAREGSGQGRVLVVEDSTETRLLLERLIAREFEVVAVETPRAALDALTRYPFDALVLDINLGGRETGLDVLRIARSLDGYADTFAMAVTAYGDEEDRDRFLTAGFQAYVQKPFDPHRILEPLRSAIAVAIGQETT
ncbi:MAG: response regulator, partial [Bacteroidota bacterium]